MPLVGDGCISADAARLLPGRRGPAAAAVVVVGWGRYPGSCAGRTGVPTEPASAATPTCRTRSDPGPCAEGQPAGADIFFVVACVRASGCARCERVANGGPAGAAQRRQRPHRPRPPPGRPRGGPRPGAAGGARGRGRGAVRRGGGRRRGWRGGGRLRRRGRWGGGGGDGAVAGAAAVGGGWARWGRGGGLRAGRGDSGPKCRPAPGSGGALRARWPAAGGA